MSWAGKRRFLILLSVGTLFVAFLAVVLIATLYETPTCTDGVQNQNESGVDCGGACAYLCTADQIAPTVLYTKALQNSAGRTDVVAEIENKNSDVAAKNVPYRLTLYGADQVLIQQVNGFIDLPPAARVPVYVPGIVSGKQTVAAAFLEITESPNWFSLTSDPRIMPEVSTPTPSNLESAPRVDVVLGNASVVPLKDVRAVIIVRDSLGEVIAVSQTVLPLIPGQGQARATYVWNEPFVRSAATFTVLPVIPLP